MLYDKIKTIYPQLTNEDFGPRGTITLQNDSDGKGDYIAKWDHPTFIQPTQAQLDALDTPPVNPTPTPADNTTPTDTTTGATA
jgi:hypothetical protein